MNIAFLVDADNVSPNWVEEFFKLLHTKGTILHRRVYGDFSSSSLTGWCSRSIRNRFVPVQQFNKKGGNSTDMRLIIDAMDILYLHPEVDCFCIASSDADYLSLISRLQEAGKKVIVFGGSLLSSELKRVADEFYIFGSETGEKEELEKISEDTDVEKEEETPSIPTRGEISQKDFQTCLVDYPVFEALVDAYSETAKTKDGWCPRGLLGLAFSNLKKERGLREREAFGKCNLSKMLFYFYKFFEKRDKNGNYHVRLKDLSPYEEEDDQECSDAEFLMEMEHNFTEEEIKQIREETQKDLHLVITGYMKNYPVFSTLISAYFTSDRDGEGWCTRVSLGKIFSNMKKDHPELSVEEYYDTKFSVLLKTFREFFDEKGTKIQSAVRLKRSYEKALLSNR